MELETIVKAIFIGLVLLLHLPDHPKSRFFYSKNESGVGSHKNPLSLPKSRLYTYLPLTSTFNEKILAIHIYPGMAFCYQNCSDLM